MNYVPNKNERKQIYQKSIRKRTRTQQTRRSTKWEPEVEDDLQQLGMNQWKKKARKNKEWRKIVHQAMSLEGLQCLHTSRRKLLNSFFLTFSILQLHLPIVFSICRVKSLQADLKSCDLLKNIAILV